MKWPNSLTLVRHGQSEYNILRAKKSNDPDYQAFLEAFHRGSTSNETRALAQVVRNKFSLGVNDYDTPLTDEGIRQAKMTGKNLRREVPWPNIIFASPYFRTKETLLHILSEWPELRNKVVYDDRIREQEHGLALLYNDSRVFQTFHPEQRAFRELMGPYWYQYPQGESVSQVRDRIRSFADMLIRECGGKDVLVVTHHLTILSIRANLERLTPEDFIRLDEHEKPINCGVTLYKGDPHKGSDGKLELAFYNKCLWNK